MYKHYRLSKIVDLNSGGLVNIKSIVGRYYTFYENSLVVGKQLSFRDINHPLGEQVQGEIQSIREEIIRKRPYVIIQTQIRDYYLTEYQRHGNV